MVRLAFYGFTVGSLAAVAATAAVVPAAGWALLAIAPIIAVGVYDVLQPRRSLLRNYPVIGHGRYLLEALRPEIQQYFVESDTDGAPFDREHRSIVYRRAKRALQTVPFGTQRDVYGAGAEWMTHSLVPRRHEGPAPRVRIGSSSCSAPYDAAYLNVSAMSYGSLGRNAVQSLNRGARRGGFAHNTGEGGISPHHLVHGGDLIWQIGTGYFGCRTLEGQFDRDRFGECSRLPEVKMIEIKLSQGAKPAHGGILPAAKLTPEVAQIRGVPLDRDVISPAGHTAFDGPVGLIEFVAELRNLSGGKPVGIKLCVGDRSEFLALCKAMLRVGATPDFIAIDGAEGGTGAAPLEFTNSVGTPLREGLLFVHNALVGAGLREHTRIIASGKIITGFDMVRALALGADLCASARGMMLALGCIQARRCNSNSCPVGIATTDARLGSALVVADKAERVANFHAATVASLRQLASAAGLDSPADVEPQHVWRRDTDGRVRNYDETYEYLAARALVDGGAPRTWADAWERARADSYGPAERTLARLVC